MSDWGHGMGDYPPGVTGADIDRLEGTDYRLPDECCAKCRSYNGDYCTKEWNNMDEDYKVEDRDAKDPDDYCEDFDFYPEWDD